MEASEHRHQWSVVDFYVEDDRPMMRQSCACGATRSIRAWDRTWDPTTPRAAGEKVVMHE
jgi:hypothetical protein